MNLSNPLLHSERSAYFINLFLPRTLMVDPGKCIAIERAVDILLSKFHRKMSDTIIIVQNLIPLLIICLADKPELEWVAERPWSCHILKVPNREYKLIKS